ncbi:MAG: NAD(P)H-dependent oxidoreductase [Clostridia bacterium]|nr:NAD(P)H-dependent oxidoreductase [Clostridia bacterium]
MKKIKVIVGSVRDERAGIKVAHWVMEKAESYHGNLSFELVDLKEVDLPLLNEPKTPKSGAPYKYEHTKKWSQVIKEADGFIFVTPEYNHGYSSALKNAIDYLYYEWREKPAAFVGYGSRGAVLSIRQLSEVIEMIGMVIISERIGINQIYEAFDESGSIKNENVNGDIIALFETIEKHFI